MILRLFIGLCAFSSVSAANFFEFRGFLRENVIESPEFARIKEIENVLKKEIKEKTLFVGRYDFDEEKSRLLFFTGYLETDSDIEGIAGKYKESDKELPFVIAFWRKIQKLPDHPETRDITGCVNGGSQLPNGTCACGPFTSGTHCETVKCQRKGIVEGADKDRCYCPPGWYAEFCEIRGCRPPLDDNLSVDTRSFLLVLPVSKSMSDVRDLLGNNLNSTLAQLNQMEPGWMGTYLLDLVVKTNGVFVHYVTVTREIDEFMANLVDTKVVVGEESEKWPIMEALVNIQQFTRQMNPNSIIFVFSDGGDTDATGVSYTINDNTLELQATQTTMLWRSRVYLFMLQSPEKPLNSSGDQFDTFRRLVTFSHGDLFIVNKYELSTVLQSIIPRLYRPEYLDVRSFASCSDFVLDTHRDDPSQSVTVFITLDLNPNTPQNVTITATDTLLGGNTLSMDSVGPYWAVFTVPAGWENVRIQVSPSAICSAKSFIGTKRTLLWAYSDDDYIDVGNCMNLAEMPMMITLQPINFPLLNNFFVEFANSATANAFTYPMYAEVRGEPDCTFIYKIPDLPRCAAGAYTQKYTFTTSENQVMKRIHPGFCSHGAKKTDMSVVDPPIYPPQGTGDGNTCYLINPSDMGGKLHDFRQIVFAVEISTEMKDVVDRLKVFIFDITQAISQLDGNKRQFTLIVFDSEGWKALTSDYDWEQFGYKFGNFIDKYMAKALPPGNGAFSWDAIYQATQLEIISPAVVHVFTKSRPKGSDHYWVLPTDIQVNYFYISENGDLPSYGEMILMQKQTEGRLISIRTNDITKDFFSSSIFTNNLIVDDGNQKCATGAEFKFQVEKAASLVEITVLGSNVNQKDAISITDGNNKKIPLENYPSSLASISSIVIPIQTKDLSDGQWTATIIASGACYFQARAVSDVNVALGFTSDVHSDFPAKHPFAKRGVNLNAFAVIRATNSAEVSKMSILPVSFTAPWDDAKATATDAGKITEYDKNTCAYQYRTSAFSMPLADNLKMIVTGKDSNGSPWTRQFNYYTPADDSSECFGGHSNEFGECSCPGNHTGEYCWDRVCAYGSTPSKGICMCYSYFYGERCENVRYVQSDATEPPMPPPSTTPTTTTLSTTTTTKKSASSLGSTGILTVFFSTIFYSFKL